MTITREIANRRRSARAQRLREQNLLLDEIHAQRICDLKARRKKLRAELKKINKELKERGRRMEHRQEKGCDD